MPGSDLVSERLLARERIKLRADFLRVSASGHKVHSARFLFLVLGREDGGPSRLGITVTRKVANAVGRNRIKRVLREVFRRNRNLFPEGCDVVVIAKDRAPGLSYEDTRAELSQASRSLTRAGRAAPRVPPQTSGRRNQTEETPVRTAGESPKKGPAKTGAAGADRGKR